MTTETHSSTPPPRGFETYAASGAHPGIMCRDSPTERVPGYLELGEQIRISLASHYGTRVELFEIDALGYALVGKVLAGGVEIWFCATEHEGTLEVNLENPSTWKIPGQWPARTQPQDAQELHSVLLERARSGQAADENPHGSSLLFTLRGFPRDRRVLIG